LMKKNLTLDLPSSFQIQLEPNITKVSSCFISSETNDTAMPTPSFVLKVPNVKK
jgi:hypothetical protein